MILIFSEVWRSLCHPNIQYFLSLVPDLFVLLADSYNGHCQTEEGTNRSETRLDVCVFPQSNVPTDTYLQYTVVEINATIEKVATNSKDYNTLF